MEYRIEHDSMGEMKVPADRLWAAQTQRSHENFEIGVGIEAYLVMLERPVSFKQALLLCRHSFSPFGNELQNKLSDAFPIQTYHQTLFDY